MDAASTLITAKLGAVFFAWLLASIPALCAVLIWVILGGHLSAPETLNLFFGHLLYGMLIGSIALFAASISDSAATAAIVTLAFTIGSWVLDFTAAGHPGVLGWLSQLSLTQTLRSFEQGLLSSARVVGAPSTWGGAWRRGSGRVGGQHDIRSQVTLRRLPLSRRGHQPRRLALLPLSAQPAHGGRDAGRPRPRREP